MVGRPLFGELTRVLLVQLYHSKLNSGIMWAACMFPHRNGTSAMCWQPRARTSYAARRRHGFAHDLRLLAAFEPKELKFERDNFRAKTKTSWTEKPVSSVSMQSWFRLMGKSSMMCLCKRSGSFILRILQRTFSKDSRYKPLLRPCTHRALSEFESTVVTYCKVQLERRCAWVDIPLVAQLQYS
jgi:hypothetical protein